MPKWGSCGSSWWTSGWGTMDCRNSRAPPVEVTGAMTNSTSLEAILPVSPMVFSSMWFPLRVSLVGGRWQCQAGVGVAAIPVRHLVQVLLVVILGEEVGEVTGRCDFRGDLGIAAILDDRRVCIPGDFC